MSDVISLSKQLRDALEKQDKSEFDRLSRSFQSMTNRLEGSIDALSRDLSEAKSKREVERLPSYKRLKKEVDEELSDYKDYLINELILVAGLWLGLGVNHSTLLTQQAAGDAGIDFEPIPFDALLLQSLNRYLDEGSPLLVRLQVYGKANADRIKQLIFESIGLGLGPRELARKIVAEGLGMALTDALRMARTLQLYAYREATLLNYQQYDIIKGWVWMSALIPGRTCISCVNMHGTIHTKDEVLNDHHNGLCAMLPYLGQKNPVTQNGEAWFGSLDKGTQIKMMGQSKWDAWQAGKFNLSDVTGIHVDDVYGEMRIERSLKDLLNE